MAARCVVTTIVVAGLLGGCAVPQGTAYNPNPPPPPVRAEAIPRPPVTETLLIWQPGHWDWNGSGYIWTSGRWIERGSHSQWQDGHWAAQGVGWVWVAGHWVS